jgi:hypothetical protein
MKKLHAIYGGVTLTPMIDEFVSLCKIPCPTVEMTIPVVDVSVSILPLVESVDKKGVVPNTGRFVNPVSDTKCE